MSEVTSILQQIESGDAKSYDQLIPLILQQLQQLASAHMADERTNHTLSATALVNEAFIRLVGEADRPHWNGSAHFFGAAAEAMRRILIDHARRKQSLKRGGNLRREPIDVEAIPEIETSLEFAADDLLELDQALTALEDTDAESAELVKLRFFAGLTGDQAAERLGISPRTADFRWSYARAWLRRHIEQQG